jgi:hypothetical protein
LDESPRRDRANEERMRQGNSDGVEILELANGGFILPDTFAKQSSLS